MAAAIALAKALYPISSAPDSVLEAWYAWAAALVGTTHWGSLRTQAIAHLLGHAAEVWLRDTAGGTSTGGGSGGAGVVTSAKSSTLALSLGAWAGAGAWTPATVEEAALSKTQGGRAYLILRGSIIDISTPVVG